MPDFPEFAPHLAIAVFPSSRQRWSSPARVQIRLHRRLHADLNDIDAGGLRLPIQTDIGLIIVVLNDKNIDTLINQVGHGLRGRVDVEISVANDELDTKRLENLLPSLRPMSG